jgi:hypothetical protein
MRHVRDVLPPRAVELRPRVRIRRPGGERRERGERLGDEDRPLGSLGRLLQVHPARVDAAEDRRIATPRRARRGRPAAPRASARVAASTRRTSRSRSPRPGVPHARARGGRAARPGSARGRSRCRGTARGCRSARAPSRMSGRSARIAPLAAAGCRSGRSRRSTPPSAQRPMFDALPYEPSWRIAVTAVPSGRLPRERQAEPVGLVPEAAPEDERVEPEAAEDLRQLGDVAEGVRHVADAHRLGAEPCAYRPADEEVADERLRAGEELVGQDVRTGPSTGDRRRGARRNRGSRSGRSSTTSSRMIAWPSSVNVRNRGSVSRTSQIVSTTRASRSRKTSNGRYHSRSQCVCGTIVKW